ncbi:protein Wnt-11b-2-like isoform X1 [Danaus plexippus]|uniref:protein Wnt-11b-2-like isoform X1 n=1 Tax=Danaus plexippus TaxID=13037 RepID=UPI002AAF1644|nr:protein Wnt-11b-2-like isoform X1 [Danaus plexippus]
MRFSVVILIFIFVFLPKSTKGIRWLALHESVGNWSESDCSEARRSGWLYGVQARVCRRQPAAMPHVAAAARLARAACLAAHAGERWNCSSIELAPKYTPDLLTGTREQAYVYAMSAAALSWSVARACAAGALAACSCAAPPRAPPRPPRQAAPTEPHARFKWGGCGDNFQWAERFAKQFLDAHEIDVRDGRVEEETAELEPTTERTTTTSTEPTTAPPVVILVDDQPAAGNTSVAPRRKGRRGRKRLPRSPRRGRPTRKRFRSRYDYEEDKEIQYRNIEYRMAADDPRFDPQVDLNTRLQYLRPLIASANLINNRFGRKVVSQGMRTKCTCHGVSGSCSVRTCWRSLSSLSRAAAALSQQSARASVLPAHSSPRRAHRPRRAARLRYVTPSPDYCEPDPAAGSLGTHGRRCNATLGASAGGCGRLCCGRGRRALRSSRLERCRCRYHWCCRVDCQLCRVTTEDHYCN